MVEFMIYDILRSLYTWSAIPWIPENCRQQALRKERWWREDLSILVF